MNNKENENLIDHNKRVFDMIGLLRKNGKMKAHELATAMGFKSTRSINKYKNCIQKMGLNIKTTGGYYGGYELVEPERLTEYEIKLIDASLGENEYYLLEKIKLLNGKI